MDNYLRLLYILLRMGDVAEDAEADEHVEMLDQRNQLKRGGDGSVRPKEFTPYTRETVGMGNVDEHTKPPVSNK